MDTNISYSLDIINEGDTFIHTLRNDIENHRLTTMTIYNTQDNPFNILIKINSIDLSYYLSIATVYSDMQGIKMDYVKDNPEFNNKAKTLYIIKHNSRSYLSELFILLEDTFHKPLPSELWQWLEAKSDFALGVARLIKEMETIWKQYYIPQSYINPLSFHGNKII